MYQSIPKPPIPPGHLTFLKNFGQISHYVTSLEGQLPHPPGKTESLTFGNKQNRLLIYVIAWGRGQLRLISQVFSKFSQNCLSCETTRAIWKTLKIRVKLILNCLRALAITCLSHKGQNFVQRTTFNVLPLRKQVCQSLFNRLAVARAKPTIIVSKTQHLLASIRSKQFLYKHL